MIKLFRVLKKIFNGEIAFNYIYERIYNIYKANKIKKYKNKPRLILIGTPNTSNLGDHLITEAEVTFLKQYFKDYDIIEVTGDCIRYANKIVKRKVMDDDIILITGGGFLGSLWMSEEEMVRTTIKMFNKNKIVILPQTIYFEETKFGREQLNKTKEVYSSHHNLYLCAREENSYKLFKEEFKEYYKGVFLVPDMALFYNRAFPNIQRKDITFCIRNDKESIISKNVKEKIFSSISKYNYKVVYTDTVIDKAVHSNKRMTELNRKLMQFLNAKLVITDRLHGMIMAAITSTPCIAFNNKTGKVGGVYKWIKNLEYVVCLSNEEELHYYIDKFLNSKEHYKYSNEDLHQYYDELAMLINKLLNKEE